MKADRKNSAWLASQYIILLIGSFISLKLNINHFGEKLFGIWITLASIWGVGGVIDLGFGTAIIRYVAEAKSSKNKEKVDTIVSTGMILFVFIGIALFFIGNLVAELMFYNNSNIVPYGLEGLARLIFVILGCAFFFQYLSIFFRSIFEGLSDFVLSSKINIINNLLILCSVITVSALDFSIIILSLSYLGSAIIIMLLHLLFLKTKYKDISIKLSFIDFSKIKGVFNFSINVQFATLFGALVDPSIKYVIGNYNISLIPMYEISRRFSVAISGLFSTAFRNALPKASVLKNRNDYNAYILSDGISLSSMGLSYSGIVFGIGAILFTTLIKIVFGFEVSIIIFFLLCLSESINNIGLSNYLFLTGIGRAGYLIVIQLCNLLLVPTSIWLGLVLFESYFGIIGYFVSAIIVNAILLYFVKKESFVPMKYYFKSIKGYKMVLLHLLIIGALIFLNKSYNPYYISGLISVICLVVFWNDLLKYFTYFLNLTKKFIPIKI